MTQYLESNAAFRIIGVVYLHPIVERRLSSTARQILQLLKDICGQEYYPNIVFATSLWDTAPDSMHQELEQREKLLRQDKEIWGEMILKGACCERLSGTPESSKRIIGVCLRMARPPPLRIMSELRTGTSLEATTVLRREQYPSPKPWLVTGLGKTSSDIEILAILRYGFPIADDDHGAKDIIR